MVIHWRNTVYKLFLILIFAYSCFMMGEITWRYRNFDLDASFLQIKQTEVTGISWYKYVFYIHVIFAVLALPAGFTQFSERFFNKFKVWHRRLGFVYVIAILFFAAPSGFLIGLYANGGLLSQIAFCLLAILWFGFTFFALKKAFEKNFTSHKDFMIRSFALTCSALTLRYWKVVLVYFFQPNPMDIYQIIAWLGWVPNLLIAEWIINRNRNL